MDVIPNLLILGRREDNRLIVSRCNETHWEWWQWELFDDGSWSEPSILIDLRKISRFFPKITINPIKFKFLQLFV